MKFEQEKELIKLKLKLGKELEQIIFDNKKELLEFEKKCRMDAEKFKNNNAREFQRIRSAEIKRTIDRKADRKFIER